MKKLFLLCLAVCLLGLASCSSNDSSKNNTKSGSPAYVEATKVLDEFEAAIDKSKSCDDLYDVMTDLLDDMMELAEKYPDDDCFLESEQDEIENRSEKLGEKWGLKAKKLGCDMGDMDLDDWDFED